MANNNKNHQQKNYFTMKREKFGDEWPSNPRAARSDEIKGSTTRILQDLAKGNFDLTPGSMDLYYLANPSIHSLMIEYCMERECAFIDLVSACEMLRGSDTIAASPNISALTSNMKNIFDFYSHARQYLNAFSLTGDPGYIINLSQLCHNYRNFIDLNRAVIYTDKSKGV